MKTENEIKEMIDDLISHSLEIPSFLKSSREKIKERIEILDWILSDRKDIEVKNGNLDIPRERLSLSWYPFPDENRSQVRIHLKGLEIIQCVENKQGGESMEVNKISMKLGDILDLVHGYRKEVWSR